MLCTSSASPVVSIAGAPRVPLIEGSSWVQACAPPGVCPGARPQSQNRTRLAFISGVLACETPEPARVGGDVDRSGMIQTIGLAQCSSVRLNSLSILSLTAEGSGIRFYRSQVDNRQERMLQPPAFSSQLG